MTEVFIERHIFIQPDEYSDIGITIDEILKKENVLEKTSSIDDLPVIQIITINSNNISPESLDKISQIIQKKENIEDSNYSLMLIYVKNCLNVVSDEYLNREKYYECKNKILNMFGHDSKTTDKLVILPIRNKFSGKLNDISGIAGMSNKCSGHDLLRVKIGKIIHDIRCSITANEITKFTKLIDENKITLMSALEEIKRFTIYLTTNTRLNNTIEDQFRKFVESVSIHTINTMELQCDSLHIPITIDYIADCIKLIEDINDISYLNNLDFAYDTLKKKKYRMLNDKLEQKYDVNIFLELFGNNELDYPKFDNCIENTVARHNIQREELVRSIDMTVLNM